jgi:aldose 1-epimerase
MCRSGRGQVLLPWPNRIEDGSYQFDGARQQLPLDQVDERNAIHGLVRWAAWTVEEREPNRIVMGHRLHPQPGYPFALAIGIEYLLSAGGLRVRTTATNVGPSRCPYGSGAHPYLRAGTATVDATILRVPASTVLRSDARGIPIGTASVEGTEFDFRRPRPIGETRLDHCFTDLERDEAGVARVDLMLFTGDPLPDVDRRSLAVEPMTCPPNAFRTGQAVILEPGESFTSSWGIGLA